MLIILGPTFHLLLIVNLLEAGMMSSDFILFLIVLLGTRTMACLLKVLGTNVKKETTKIV